jgi:fructokinase
MNTGTPQARGPVIFGEVLFDCFPDRRVLGGAPFNVAWNLHGLGQDPLFVGAVGDDEPGAEIGRIMADWGMDRSGLQVDPAHPTGRVQISLEGGEPRYEIVPDQAYDHIRATPALQALRGREGDILYHGSLALRSPESRATLGAMRERLGGRVFLDVNLRDPWWDAGAVQAMLAAATWAKLNQDELHALAPGEYDSLQHRASDLLERFGLAAVIVTCAAEGALVVAADGTAISRPAPAVEGLVDTVGAGDAFSAVTLTGLLNGWSWEVSLDRAAAFAARVCTLRGATTTDRGFYVL